MLTYFLSIYSEESLIVSEPDQPAHTRRERRVAARKVQILDAAARLFAEKGFHRTTTKDIAEAADVSEGTLYNYFENKEDMLLGIMSRLVETQHLTASLIWSIPDDAREFLYNMLSQRKEFVEQDGARLQSVFSEILVDPDLRRQYYQELVQPNFELLEAHLHARRDLGQIRDVDLALAVRILIALTTGLFFLEVLGDPLVKNQWDELSKLITSIFFDGVTPRIADC
jgi:AcrR family transcriptional regulator